MVGRVVDAPSPAVPMETSDNEETSLIVPTPTPMSSTPTCSQEVVSPVPLSPKSRGSPKAAAGKASKKFLEMLRGVRRNSQASSDTKASDSNGRRASDSSIGVAPSTLASSMSPQELTELTCLLGRRTSLTNVETQRVQALMKRKISKVTPSAPPPPPSEEEASTSLSVGELNELASLMGSRMPLTNVETQRVQALMRRKAAYMKKVTAISSPLTSPTRTSTSTTFPQEPSRRASEPVISQLRPKLRTGLSNRELSPPPMSRGRPADATVRAAAANARTVNHSRPGKLPKKAIQGKGQPTS